MRNGLRFLVLLAVSLLSVASAGEAAPAEATRPIPILQGAALPMYPPIARAARVIGKVTLKVTVKNGAVVRTDLMSKLGPAGQRFLETPTVENVKTWHFATSVNGELRVTYTYDISGAETDMQTNPTVEILPSLNVNITARPVKPTVMY